MSAQVTLSARYDVLGLLGSGSSADVYRVRDLASGEERALKVLRDPGDAAAVLAFRREFLLLLRMRHPALVNVHEFEVLPDGRPAFSAEVVSGDSLGALAPLPGPEAIAAVRDLALALDHLHRAGLVHCDLKPDNAVRMPEGNVKLLDLGLAQAPGEGRAGGTPVYMAPEIARGAPADPRADLYSLGAVGYFLLAGRPTHGGASAAEVLAAAQSAPPAPLPAEAPP
ncbi:MAG: serine/threonine protein kinase, partial [Verrucomicrobia bacterium]|nr:serine/threonine protein kinase [Verrucomicrobiota bacterium]